MPDVGTNVYIVIFIFIRTSVLENELKKKKRMNTKIKSNLDRIEIAQSVNAM